MDVTAGVPDLAQTPWNTQDVQEPLNLLTERLTKILVLDARELVRAVTHEDGKSLAVARRRRGGGEAEYGGSGHGDGDPVRDERDVRGVRGVVVLLVLCPALVERGDRVGEGVLDRQRGSYDDCTAYRDVDTSVTESDTSGRCGETKSQRQRW